MIVEVRRAAARLVPAAVVIYAALVGLGLLVSRVLPGTALGDLDAAVPRRLVGVREGGQVPESLLVSDLSTTTTIIALTAVAVVVLRLVLRRWRESVFVAFSVIGEVVIFTLTTLVVKRDRPPVARLDTSPPTSSFPSGHTAAATVFYGSIAAVVIWRTRRTWLQWLAGALAVLLPLGIGSARVYRGMHYPTDVLGGLLLGASWLTVMVLVVLRDPAVHDDAAPDRSEHPRLAA